MIRKVNAVIYIIIGLLVAIGPYTFLHVCAGGMSMDGMDMDAPVCQGIPPVTLVIGILLAAVGLTDIVTIYKGIKSKAVKAILELVSAVLGIITIGVPTFIIGVCNSDHMHCSMVTKPALIIFGAAIVLFSLVGIFASLRGNGENDE